MDRGLATVLLDIAAILVTVFALYFPRHRRRDLVLAYLAVNVGVLAIARLLSSGEVGIGLGFGLFGVLSIIRLRSMELSQNDIGYYFSALALGLLGGLSIGSLGAAAALMALVVAALFVGDHPRLFSNYRRELVVLDRAFTDEGELRAELERRLGATIHRFSVTKLDLVNEITWVDVRYTVRAPVHLEGLSGFAKGERPAA
jgi:Domain of unknown function (DUF4956)